MLTECLFLELSDENANSVFSVIHKSFEEMFLIDGAFVCCFLGGHKFILTTADLEV